MVGRGWMVGCGCVGGLPVGCGRPVHMENCASRWAIRETGFKVWSGGSARCAVQQVLHTCAFNGQPYSFRNFFGMVATSEK